MKRIICNPWLWLALILLLGLCLRLYKVDIPLADHHSWRQADTAAVARNFIKEGFDFLHPKIDNMTPVSKEMVFNPRRYFFVEPPIYQTIVAGLYSLFGVQEKLARMVSIAFSLGAIVFLYLLVRKLTNQWVGLLASFFMAALPFSIYYSRVVMPETEMLFTSLTMLYFFLLWLEKQTWQRFGLAVFFAAWALTLKIFPLFLALPMLYLVWRKWGLKFVKQKPLYLFVIIALLPFALWRLWISQYPEGIPSYVWLFNLYGIRFRPAFFRWIFAERISKLILGYWGLPLLVFGLILKPRKKEGWFFYWWLAAFFTYVTIFASGNVTHDYYQIPFIPLAAIFLAKGSYWLLVDARQQFNRLLCCLLFVVCCLFMLGFSWYEVKGFYLIQGGVDLAGLAVDELTPKDTLVLTGDSNDATLLYNTNRHGWTGGYASYFPNEKESLNKAREMGAEFYVTTKVKELKDMDFGQFLYQEFKLVKETDQYAIFDLR
ncbi:glycosyltransferase family 39 protein [Patescibacteria group bacterium]|nr:glycosyltransferase family 39 protein [Patescibacteria group bacterium]